jgi:hypothetical protein
VIVILKVKEIDFYILLTAYFQDCLGVLAGTMGYRDSFLSSLLC